MKNVKSIIIIFLVFTFILNGCGNEISQEEKQLLKLKENMLEYKPEDNSYEILFPDESWSVIKQEGSYISFASKDVGTISINRLDGEEAKASVFPTSAEEATKMILDEGISQDRFELIDFGQEDENTVKMEVCLKIDENTDMYEFITLNKSEDVLYKKVGMILDNKEETMKLVQLSMDSYQQK